MKLLPIPIDYRVGSIDVFKQEEADFSAELLFKYALNLYCELKGDTNLTAVNVNAILSAVAGLTVKLQEALRFRYYHRKRNDDWARVYSGGVSSSSAIIRNINHAVYLLRLQLTDEVMESGEGLKTECDYTQQRLDEIRSWFFVKSEIKSAREPDKRLVMTTGLCTVSPTSGVEEGSFSVLDDLVSNSESESACECEALRIQLADSQERVSKLNACVKELSISLSGQVIEVLRLNKILKKHGIEVGNGTLNEDYGLSVLNAALRIS